MKVVSMTAPVFVLALMLATFLSPARADSADPCAGYSWDVSQERALFGSQAMTAIDGGATPASVTMNRLYAMHLAVQGLVNFASPPSKKIPADPAYAGLATLELSTPGTYRISGDSSFWIDVVVAGKVVESRDHQGQKGCNSPHKIVEFELPAAVPVLLEFSGASTPEIRFSVTATPSAKP
jgi:hypothetical protein